MRLRAPASFSLGSGALDISIDGDELELDCCNGPIGVCGIHGPGVREQNLIGVRGIGVFGIIPIVTGVRGTASPMTCCKASNGVRGVRRGEFSSAVMSKGSEPPPFSAARCVVGGAGPSGCKPGVTNPVTGYDKGVRADSEA